MTPKRLKVLLVEDEPMQAELLQQVLVDVMNVPLELTHLSRFADTLQRVSSERFDVVLLDLTLPDHKGLRSYAALHAAAPALPIIVLTGIDDENLALQAVREGAQDYLVKGQFDGKMLARVINYAIERKRAEDALRQSEEFFRLISENVTDLIAVVDKDGRRLYNSPSYRALLGEPQALIGTNSFEEVHPQDQTRIQSLFRDAMTTGAGQRAEYRMILRDGTVRHIESQANVINDDCGQPAKMVVVSRDITERKEAIEVLRNALSDVKASHEELKTAQLQLVQSERLEAVSTFAAGVAHEVKNPLQTIILGVDYLSMHVAGDDAQATGVLRDMGDAVLRADAIIRGLLEFSAYNKRTVQDEDLSSIVEQSLRAVNNELINYPITLVKNLGADLPRLRLDLKTMKHVFINLLMYSIRTLTDGGKLVIRTHSKEITQAEAATRKTRLFKAGDTVVIAEVEHTPLPQTSQTKAPGRVSAVKDDALGFAVLKKIVELYGGLIETFPVDRGGSRHTITFKAPKQNYEPKTHSNRG